MRLCEGERAVTAVHCVGRNCQVGVTLCRGLVRSYPLDVPGRINNLCLHAYIPPGAFS